MKVTNGEIFEAREPLGKLLVKEMPVKASYKLATLAHKFNDQLKIVEQVRVGLFKTYGQSDPSNPAQFKCPPHIVETDAAGAMVLVNGLPNMIENPKFPKFMAEMTELMEQEIEIVVDAVALPDTLEIEPAVLMALEKFVKVK